MNVLMISGSHPPEVCGIGDYTAALLASLQQDGLNVTTLPRQVWRLRHVRSIVAAIRERHADLVHLQYPGEGYGWSLTPQCVGLRIPMVVTLHEFSFARMPRKLSLLPFLLAATHIVFTTIDEQDAVSKLFPWVARKSSVIRIGSNIPQPPVPGARSFQEVLYFGLLAPQKGLEDVLQFADCAQRDGPGISVHIVGRIVPRFRAYAEDLIARAVSLPIRWTLDQPPEAVAEIMAAHALAYLPFPDGASERRGSLKAALAAGVVCLATIGPHTTAEMEQVIVSCASPEEAYRKAKLLLKEQSLIEELAARQQLYAQSFRWQNIADKHVDLYTRLLKYSEPRR